MMEDKMAKKHIVNMIDRKRLSMSGVTDVFSFDEEVLELETEEGYVEIKGELLHIIKMNVDDGELIVEGKVNELTYHDSLAPAKKKGSLMSKLFR